VAWTARFRRQVRECERLPTTLVSLHLVAFVCLLRAQITFQFHVSYTHGHK
jgi:hypothetical protein